MSETVSCQSCGRLVAKDDSFCPGCGSSVVDGDTATGIVSAIRETNPTQCVQCSAPMGRDDRFCSKCGASRPEDATVVSHVSLRNAQAARLIEATQGEFEIVQRIGHGAMGAVYLARDIALGRRVAIKVIAPHLLSDEAMVSRFKLEAQTVASLRHPNIVNVHGVREDEDLHYFVMEFIDGPPLRTLIKRHAPLDAHVVKGILYQVGSALSYAHRAGAGVIHRDIKPANIMVNLEGDAFVTDFGISKIADLQSGLTQTGATIGTPEYMSPEQCRGELLTGASDQYALGIVAYEMICGSTPFSGSHLTIMMAHAQEPPRPVREVRSDCPPEIAEAVERMLAKSPEDRWPDLDAAVTSMGGAPLGYKDPTRARIVALVRATDVEGASGGVATAPPSVAPAAQMAAPAGGVADGVHLTSVEQVAAEASHPEDQTRASPVPATSRPTQSSPTPSRPKPMPSMVAPAPLYRRPATIALALVAIFAIGFSAQSFLGSAGPTSVNERGGPDGLAATGDSGATGDSATQIAGGPGIPIGGRETPPVTPGGQLESGQPGVDAGGGEGEPATADAAADPTTRPGTTQRPEPEPNRSTPPRPTPTRAAPTPSTMTVRLASASMQVGETQVAAAEVRDGSGATMSDVALSWSSSAPGIVRVNDDGSVRAMAEGSAYVIARTGRVRDSTLVSTVFAVEAVRIAGGDRTVEPGASGRLNAAVLGPEGVSLTRPIMWSSSNESVVSVSADGQLAAVAPGVARIRATADGISSDVTVTVQRAAPPPPTTGEVTTLLEGLIVLMTSDRARVMALWPEGRGDAGVRSQFEDRLEREDFRAEVASQEGVRLDGRGAVVSFVVAASHRANFGRRAEGTIQMRAQLLHDGGAWRIVSVGAQSVDF